MVGARRVPRSARPASGRLASRSNGLGRAQVAQIQRARMLCAMVDVVLECGAGNVTVAHVVERSGVSRRTFYEIFADREECFLAAFDDALERIAMVLVPAYESEGRWHERIRAALTELLGFLDEDPSVGRLVIVESLAAGPEALERRNHVLQRLIAVVDEGRLEGGAGSEPPVLTAEGVVGAVCSILYARLLACLPVPYGAPSVMGGSRMGEDDRQPLVELTGQLMGMIVLPYLGKVAARSELQRPVPPPRTVVPRSATGYPFRDLGMRLTYRTLRVLEVLSEHAGLSNRMVGEQAGVPDQGQISKLLSRLRRLGLVHNTSDGHTKGEPNAWRLTRQGVQVTQTIRAHAHNNTEVA
jgi:AcrR family transcriptional regulator